MAGTTACPEIPREGTRTRGLCLAFLAGEAGANCEAPAENFFECFVEFWPGRSTIL